MNGNLHSVQIDSLSINAVQRQDGHRKARPTVYGESPDELTRPATRSTPLFKVPYGNPADQ